MRLWLEALAGGIWEVWALKSCTALSYNAILREKHQFYCVFLKVRAPETAIYSNLANLLGSAVASQDHRPSIKTARTPTVKLFGEIYFFILKIEL